MVGYGDFGRVMDTLEPAVAGGSYIAGDRFTAADVYVGSQTRLRPPLRLHRGPPGVPRLLATASPPARPPPAPRPSTTPPCRSARREP